MTFSILYSFGVQKDKTPKPHNQFWGFVPSDPRTP